MNLSFKNLTTLRLVALVVIMNIFTTSVKSMQTQPAVPQPAAVKKNEEPELPLTFNRKMLYSGYFAFGLLLARLVTKDGPETMPYTPVDGLNDIKKTPFLTKEFWQKMGNWFDNVIIGFPGKKKGLSPIGSKLFVQGKEKVISSKLSPDGTTTIQIIHYENIPGYGLLGIIWSDYAGPISDMLGKVAAIISASKTIGSACK